MGKADRFCKRANASIDAPGKTLGWTAELLGPPPNRALQLTADPLRSQSTAEFWSLGQSESSPVLRYRQ
jgi:hypothetical protein